MWAEGIQREAKFANQYLVLSAKRAGTVYDTDVSG